MSYFKKIIYITLISGSILLCGGCKKETPLSFSTSEEIISEESTETENSEKQKKPRQTENKENGSGEKKEQEEKKADEPCAVYICGAVTKPGVYEVPQKSRIYEVVEKAGGLREDAAADCINQADRVSDAQMIKVYTQEEMANLSQQAEERDSAVNADETQQTSQKLVNINTASKEELMTLRGIGESKADSIIKYRETTGAFGKIEDIKNITGIKDGVFEKIKDSITV